jgi:hypothetical protein
VTTVQAVTDGVGDVVNTLAPGVLDNPRADISGASVEYAPGWIRMKVQVKTPTDPLQDKAWSDRSDAEWALDTNNDGRPDYTVEFATDKGQLYGAVFDATKPDTKSLCDADSASFSPADGYTVVIDPKCIGNPKTLGYAVAIFFVTDPKDDKAPIATDRVPDEGFKAMAAPLQPGESAPAGAPAGAPASTSGGAAPASGAPVKPGMAPSPSPGSTTPGRVAAGTAGSPSPAGAQGGAPAAPSSAGSSAAGAAPTPSVAAGAPGGPLARTGSASEQRALVGLGLMLLGIGVLVMTRPTRRAAPLRF